MLGHLAPGSSRVSEKGYWFLNSTASPYALSTSGQHVSKSDSTIFKSILVTNPTDLHIYWAAYWFNNVLFLGGKALTTPHNNHPQAAAFLLACMFWCSRQLCRICSCNANDCEHKLAQYYSPCRISWCDCVSTSLSPGFDRSFVVCHPQ